MNNDDALFSTRSMVLFVIVVVVILALLFPGKKLLDELKEQKTDNTSLHYLQASLEKTPENGALRLHLATEQLKLGLREQATETLQALLNNSQYASEARLLLLDVQFQDYFDVQSEARQQILKRSIIRTITDLYGQVTTISTLDLLAQKSQQLGEPLLAAKIYQRIVQLLTQEPITETQLQSFLWGLLGVNNAYAEEGIIKNVEYYAEKHLQALLAANEMTTALAFAQKYVVQFSHSLALLQQAIKIAGYADAPIQARDLGRLYVKHTGFTETAIKAQIQREQAANEPKNSLVWLMTALSLSSELALLEYGSQLASSLGNNELATQLGLKLLQQRPGDEQLIEQQIHHELVLNNFETALDFAQQAVLRNPDSRKAHEQLANIALWTAHPELILEQWHWLYLNTGEQRFLWDAVKLGKRLFNFDVVADLYARLGQKRRLSDSELDDFYVVLQKTGFIDAGAEQLKTYVKQHPDHRQAWLYLAKTYERTGFYSEAIAALKFPSYIHILASLKNLSCVVGHQVTAENILQESKQTEKCITAMQKQFMDRSDLLIYQARLLLKNQAFDAAWAVVYQFTNIMPHENTEFWTLYTQLAWLTGHDVELGQGYYYLLVNNAIEPGYMGRLLDLQKSRLNDEQQRDLFILAFDKTQIPDYLLNALELTEKAKQDGQTEQLLRRTEQKLELFANKPRYWVMKAGIASRKKQSVKAKEYLYRALELDKNDADLRANILWHMVDFGANRELHALLQSNLKLAQENSVLWEPVAAVYRRLAEPKRSAYWYARAVKLQPENYLLLLAYADVLNEAGEYKKSRKIQHYILTKIYPALVMQTPLEPQGIGSSEFKRRYGEVVRDQLGADAADKWFTWAEKQNKRVQEAIFTEYRITWFLAKGRIEQARWHILRELHRRIRLPAWQQLALAVQDNDVEKIEQLLDASRDLLASDKVVGLRSLRRNASALMQVKNLMKSDSQAQELAVLRRQASDLGAEQANGFAFTGLVENISELDIWGIHGDVAISRDAHRYELSYQFNHFSSSQKNFMLTSEQRTENNLQFKWKWMRGTYTSWLKASFSLREDQNLYGFSAHVQRNLWGGWSIFAEGAYNELSTESAAFRLLGARDRISLGFQAELSKRHSFSAVVHGRHYKSRSGDFLGVGYGFDAQTAYRFRYAQPSIDINLYASLTKANLVDTLPAEISMAVAGRPISSVLSNDYAEVGLNFSLYDGELRPFGFVQRDFHYYLNSGVFKSFPVSSGVGLFFEAGIGMRLLENDDLSLIGRYVDVQGGVNTIPTKAIELRYSTRFF